MFELTLSQALGMTGKKEKDPLGASKLNKVREFISYFLTIYLTTLDLTIFIRDTTIFIRDTGKQVVCQTVKTQMKCSIRQHFISVYTVC